MKKLLYLFFLLPVFAIAQTYDDLDSASKAKVDSIVSHRSLIAQTKSHRKMVSFIDFGMDGINDFYSFLIYDLNYKTISPGNAVNVIKTPTGYKTSLYKYSEGYQQTKQTLTINYTTNKAGDISMVTMTAPTPILYELYLRYWETDVKPDFTKTGALEKTYLLPYETIWLYANRIVIKKFTTISSD